MRPPIVISSAADIPALLRAEREALGMTGEDLDAHIGWCDRYTAKCESPDKKWGKTVFRIERCADDWLAGLGRALVLLDRVQAENLMRQPSLPEANLRRVRVMRWAIAA